MLSLASKKKLVAVLYSEDAGLILDNTLLKPDMQQ